MILSPRCRIAKRKRTAAKLYALFCGVGGFVLALLSSLNAVDGQSLATPVDGGVFSAKLIAVDADWRLTFAEANGQTKTLPAGDLVRWGDCSASAGKTFAVFADGGVLIGDVLSADKDQLAMDTDSFGVVRLPLELLAGVVFHSPGDRSRRDQLQDRLLEAVGRSDLALLANGDEAAGQLEGVASDRVAMKTSAGSTSLPIGSVAAILLNPSLRQKTELPKGRLRVWAGFADGCRLLAERIVLENGHATITLPGVAKTLKTSAEQLVFLQPLGGRAAYLSDMKPAAYRQTPYLDLAWPYRNDRSVMGAMLCAGGKLFLKGIGVHSAARLTYEVDPTWTRFQASAALDDAAGRRGSVVFRVLVDGHERFASPTMRGGDRPVPVGVDIRGAKRLELIVDWADYADVLDRADWLDARAVLGEKPATSQNAAAE